MRRSTHRLGFHSLSTFNMGFLVPIAALEVLPGDTFRQQTSMLVRVTPQAHPVMHPVEIRVHHWYVPNRILWDGWEDFITGNEANASLPTITMATNDQLPDYMGCEVVNGVDVIAFPFRAYNLIYNEFYRDQDLSAERGQHQMALARISWEKDYFTVARPNPQKGDQVTIPLQGQPNLDNVWQSGTTDPYSGSVSALSDQSADVGITPARYLIAGDESLYGPPTFNLSDGSIDINAFRRAMALQRFAEARARFGDRYVDYLRFLGVNPSDMRLQRPEYLGGGKQTISFSEVLATAEGDTRALGEMAGHGISGVRTRPYRKMFEEHGWVLSLASVRPRTLYMRGIPRKFTRADPMDYWQKELEVLPWQEIKETELWGAGDPEVTFGWTSKYDDYRHTFSYVSGEFKTTQADWHYGREFSSAPNLNQTFVQCDPADRVYLDTQVDELQCTINHDITARRLVSHEARI